jgi:hypothetical protein
MTPAPVTFETWVNAALFATLNSDAYTNESSLSGAFDAGTYGSFNFSSRGQTAKDTTGGGTTINESSPPNNAEILTNNGVIIVTWFWGGGGASQIYQQTYEENFIGTSETAVLFTIGFDGDSATAFGTDTTTGETGASEPQTTASFVTWTTSSAASSVSTTQSAQTQETFWTYSETQDSAEAEWVTTERTASTQQTTLTNGTRQQITLSGATTNFDSEEARSTTKITRSTATYNTLILTTANRPNALETTESVDPQKQSGTTTFYGGLSLEGGTAGYTTALRTTTTSGTISWSRTQTSNRASAGIAIDLNPPRAITGQVISTAVGATRTQETTTTQAFDVLTNGETTTSIASFETISLGPAQTTRSTSVVVDVDTFVEGNFTFNGAAPRGFSVTLSSFDEFGIAEGGVFGGNADGFDGIANIGVSASLYTTASAIGVTLSPQVGFTSSIAALQTSRINTLKFAVVGQGGNSGASYQNGNEFNIVTAKSLLFAPKSAQEFLPITGSASSSNTSRSFSMRYSGATQSRSSTIGTGTDATITSVTSAWSAAGAAQTFWVNVSRGRVEGSPAFPTIPALIIGGEGQALITRGLYETYSGSGTATSSGTNNFVEVNSVSSFSGGDGVTAIKPLQYYVPITGSNAQTTSASFANNLTAQPLDD